MASANSSPGGTIQSQAAQSVYSQLPPISVKLTDANFLMWQQQVDVTAYGYGLEGFLNGEKQPPPQTIFIAEGEGGSVAPNEDFIAWQRQDRRVAAWLLSSLSEGALGLVVGLRSARDIWSALETNFASRSTAKIMQYRQMMQNQKKDTLTMSEYIGKMRNYFDLLGSVGSRISEDEQVMHILGGLGQEYDPAVCAISSRPDSWTLGDATAFLLTFESRMETTRSHSSSSEGSQPALHLMQQANQKKDFSPYNSNFGPGNGRGGSRNQRGGRGGRGFGRGGNKVICQLCEKPGHTAAKCWHRFEQNFSPAQTQPQFRGNSQNQQHQGYFNPSAHLAQATAVRPSPSIASAPSEFGFESTASTSWYPDSGATHHVSGDLANLNISSEYNGGKKLLLGNGSAVNISNIGETELKPHTGFSRKLMLKNLLHVPSITKNLLSVSKFARDNSVFFEFHPDLCFVKDLGTRETVLKGVFDRGLYHFLVDHSPIKRSSSSTTTFPVASNQNSPAVYTVSSASSAHSHSLNHDLKLDLGLWHNRLGHPTLDVVKSVLRSCNFPINSINENQLCHSCCVSKAHRLPYGSSDSVVNSPLELVHSDLWGPSPITSRNGYKYYVSFVDHCSRFTWIYLLKVKSAVIDVFKMFKSSSENLLGTRIKCLQSDWGGEYQGLTHFLKQSGISHRVSCPYTPQQNGLAERKHRHIVETGLTLLTQASLPTYFWDDAFVSAVFLINRMPSKVIGNISPFQRLYSKKPDYSALRVFGCLCYPLVRPYNDHKLESRSLKSVFLGYSGSHKGYKALLPDGRVIVSRDVVFDEKTFPYTTIFSSDESDNGALGSHFFTPSSFTDQQTSVPISGDSSSPAQGMSSDNDSVSPPSPAPYSGRSTSAPEQDADTQSAVPAVANDNANVSSKHHMTTRSKAGIFKPKLFNLAVTHYTPKSAAEALVIPAWKSAMEAEYLALLKNKTWFLTTLPPGKNLVGCTWIFKLKLHLSGDIARHKARLVAQGFSQQAGFDFTETFSPVVKPATIRLILTIAVSYGWEITHLDVNNAFLNGELKEDIYMRQPQGFEQGGSHLVCKLNKAIYGLKQASRAWFYTIHSALMSLGFTQSRADASMFIKKSATEVIYLLIYVDDILITGSCSSAVKRIITQLNAHFSLKNLGEVNLFLGVEVIKTAAGLHLCQSTYIKDLLKKANMTGAKGCPTPMVSSCELSKNIGAPVANAKLYRSVVGALQYAAITRPDINYAVNKVSQYMASPLDTHWKAVKRILRYLSGTLDYGIQIQPSNGVLSAFSDSDWASDLDDRRSTTGFCTYFGCNLISWCVKKQTVVARSSTEAEYRSLAHAAAEVAWLRSALSELKFSLKSAPIVWVDNLSAIALASNPVLHARTKHIELDIHFVRDKVLNRELDLRHVPSVDQVADIFTKPLSQQPFMKLRNRLGVVSLASLRLRGDVRSVKILELKDDEVVDSVKDQESKADVHGGRGSHDMDSCTFGKESARAEAYCVSTRSLPSQPAGSCASWNNSCTFKEALMKGLVSTRVC